MLNTSQDFKIQCKGSLCDCGERRKQLQWLLPLPLFHSFFHKPNQHPLIPTKPRAWPHIGQKDMTRPLHGAESRVQNIRHTNK